MDLDSRLAAVARRVAHAGKLATIAVARALLRRGYLTEDDVAAIVAAAGLEEPEAKPQRKRRHLRVV